MKLPAIVSAILALVAIVLLFFIDFADPQKTETFSLEKLKASSGDAQTQQLDELFARESLPAKQEVKILKWIFEENIDYGIQLVAKNAMSVEHMASSLGNAAFALIREKSPEATVRLLNQASQLFPNDPEILAAQGITYYLSGNRDEARQFLEQSAAWKKDIPIADFYLGLILIQSESVAYKARGKTLLKRVVELENFEYREDAALFLLAFPGIPMVRTETEELLNLLEELDTFRSGNDLLNPQILLLLATKAASLNAELALKLARMIMEYPEVSVRDKIFLVHLLNNAEEYEESSTFLKDILTDENAVIDEAERDELARLQAFGYLATGRYFEAEEAFSSLCESQNSEPSLHRYFKQALAMELPGDTQRKIFPLYLDLPVLDPQLSVMILTRLVEINPLKTDDWTDYAANTILPESPILAAEWLKHQKETNKIVEFITRVDTPLTREQNMALIDAHLTMEDPDAAQLVLNAGRSTLQAVHAEFYQTRIYHLKGENDLAREGWNATHNAAMADNSYTMMKNLGFLAIEMDQPVNAMQALYAAFTSGISFSPRQANQLIGLTLKYGTLSQSTNVAESLYKTFPDEPIYINNLAYFKFLANQDLDEYIAKMRPLAKDYSDILNYRMTLGLGLLKSGRNNEAMRLMQSPPIDFNKTSTQGQVIYAAILIANDQQFVAEGLIRSINQDELIPEEKALIELW